jgi:tetratricopeptide (TPR) repeat protein
VTKVVTNPPCRGDGMDGTEIRRALERKGLSVRAAARVLHYDHAFLSRVLNGRQRPSEQLLAALEELLGGEADRLAYVTAKPRRVDRTAVDALSVLLAELRRLEDALGAGLVQPTASGHLGLMRRLVVEARGPIRPAVVSLGAQFAQFRGWLLTATGQYDAADRTHRLTAEWGAEVADPDMLATAHSMRGYLSWRQGDLGSMLAYSNIARSDRHVSAGIRALAAQQAARAYALLGDAEMTDRLLNEAVELMARAAEHPDSEPPWLYFVGPSYLEMQRGRAYLYLGRHRQAAELLERGFDALPADLREAAWARSYLRDLEVARAGE